MRPKLLGEVSKTPANLQSDEIRIARRELAKTVVFADVFEQSCCASNLLNSRMLCH